MLVEIYCGEALIGRSALASDDPPMGGAAGAFEPSAAYLAQTHARELDGIENEAAADLALTVKSNAYGLIECELAFIQDYDQSLGERRICLGGIPYPQYEEWFGNDPAYKAYRAKS